MLYPLVSEAVNRKYHSDIETAYTAAIEGADTAELAAQLEAARQYNALLAGSILTGGALSPPVAYEDLLTRGGAMAYIDIPQISVYFCRVNGGELLAIFLSKNRRDSLDILLKFRILCRRHIVFSILADYNDFASIIVTPHGV